MPIAYLSHSNDPQFSIVLPETLEQVIREAKDCFYLPDDSTVLIFFRFFREDKFEAALTTSSWEWLKSEAKNWRNIQLTVKIVEDCGDLARRMKEKQQKKELANLDLGEDMHSLHLEEEKMNSFDDGEDSSPISSTSEGGVTCPFFSEPENADDADKSANESPADDDLNSLKLVVTMECSGTIFYLDPVPLTLPLKSVYGSATAFVDSRLDDLCCAKSPSESIHLESGNYSYIMPCSNYTLKEWINRLREHAQWPVVLQSKSLKEDGLNLRLSH